MKINKLNELWYKKLTRVNEELAFLSYLDEDIKFRRKFGIPEEGFQDNQKAAKHFVQKLKQDQVVLKEYSDKLIEIFRLLSFKRANELIMLEKYLLDGKYPVRFVPDSARFKKHTQGEIWVRIDGLHIEEIFENIELLAELYPKSIDTSPIAHRPGKTTNTVLHHLIFTKYKIKKSEGKFSYKQLADTLSSELYGLGEFYEEIVDKNHPIQVEQFFELPETSVENIKQIVKKYKERMEEKKENIRVSN